MFLKAQLHSSYICAFNYKPFGSSGFFQQKKEMMEKFIQSTSPTDSAVWNDALEPDCWGRVLQSHGWCLKDHGT